MSQGVWTGVPADVNWCEPDFLWSPWVAEPLNTLSSLPMVALGLYGAWSCLRSEAVPERRFVINYLGLAVVGLGSAAFHGTLMRWAQALDELPMVWLGLVGVWTVWQRAEVRGTGGGLAALALGFAALFSTAYLRAPAFFAVFIATYALCAAYMVLAAVRWTFLHPSPDTLKRVFLACVATYLGTLAFCWIPEHVLLPCDSPIQAVPLHALWHLGAGVGTYLWVLWSILDRRRTEGVDLRLDGRIVPFAERA